MNIKKLPVIGISYILFLYYTYKVLRVMYIIFTKLYKPSPRMRAVHTKTCHIAFPSNENEVGN